MPKIKTFEEACAIKELDPIKVLPDVSSFPQKHQKALTAFAKLIIIISVLNDDWEPNWNNSNEWKYQPWFYLKEDKQNPSGFCLLIVAYYYTNSDASSRLCFRDRETAKWAVEHFLDLFRDFFKI